MTSYPEHNQPLQDYLAEILPRYTDGISEYELIRLLADKPYQFFNPNILGDSLGLYQTHFILFNALYQLRDNWLAQQAADISIHCMKIQIADWTAGSAGLATNDELRRYYLDWDQFKQTGERQVEQLLNQFWRKFAGEIGMADQDIQIDSALEVLGITLPCTHKQLHYQYRKQLHLHHPDKGGSNQKTRQVTQAYRVVKRRLNELNQPA
ncbi:DNA-J related domain-containing protein [Neptunicella marina]|uniref:Molecular chaperone DnaJ n=1 Tax=Neptunicella marina TaxID=2125989 RepID=A0A8J6IV67_9ALTE|nr:DNA-J related domain-containing protein [Neptunicella marina]MBC3767296.1 molecular chaperone DnaJ [Neptunicella marina]